MSTKVFDTPRQEASADVQVRTWRDRLNRDWSFWADSRAAAYLLFAVVYVVPSVMLARQKLMWDDEFFTLYLSKTKNWADLWRALSTGADQHPPTFYYLTHLIFKVAGTSHALLRLPAIVGFALCSFCLYEIAREIMGRRWAVAAMLVPLATPSVYYATEARGYGLELGFITCSLLMWFWAAEGKKRTFAVIALAVSLFLAVASHYYALFILFPLAIGELVKIRMRRTVDFPVCGALFAALLPPLLFSPLILRALSYSKTFWAIPAWAQMVDWYPVMLGRAPLILLVAAGLAFVLNISPSEDKRSVLPQPPVAIVLAASSLLPVVGVFAAKFVTHAFTERYFIAALPGSCIILVWALRRVIANDKVGPALVATLCILLFAQQWRDQRGQQLTAVRTMRSISALLRRNPDAPVVISDVTNFHRLSFYARRDLASRIVYVADPGLSVRYLGHDTIDRGMLALNPWFPLKTISWYEWWRTHPSSLVYGTVGDWNWVTFALREVGTTELKDRDISHLLLSVNRTKLPDDDRLASDPSGKPMLYDQLTSTGAPLCSVYMPTDKCPVIDDPSFSEPIISYPEMRIRK